MAIAQARLCCVWNAIVGKAFVCVCECAQNWWLMRFVLCMNRQASVSLHYWLTSSHRNDWLTFGWLYVEHLLQSCFEFYTDQKHSAPVLIRVSFHSVNLPPHAKFHHTHSVIHTQRQQSEPCLSSSPIFSREQNFVLVNINIFPTRNPFENVEKGLWFMICHQGLHLFNFFSIISFSLHSSHGFSRFVLHFVLT